MKKTLSLLLMTVLAYGASAQTSAGSIMLGGGFEIVSSKPEGGSGSTSLYVSPSAGYFMSDNLAIGVNLGLGKTETSSDFNVGPFVRFYKFIADDKFAFYGQGGVTFSFGKDEVTTGGPPPTVVEQKSSAFSIYASPGFAYFFNEKWSLDFQLSGISFRTQDPDKDAAAVNDKSTTLEFGASSFNPSLGFRYFISK